MIWRKGKWLQRSTYICPIIYFNISMTAAERLRQLFETKATANLQAGLEFLAENAQKEGVTTLPSGLQYEILMEGTGPKPTATQTVTCHYHGTLIDERVFDSSVNRGKPASFPLNRVIPGWTEGLQLMGVGSKWRFFLPPNLAYGDRQVSAEIGPNSTLIFEVELLGIG
jgi:FKBP-type peptidyl-prolyl cis-trans isomerase FklB